MITPLIALTAFFAGGTMAITFMALLLVGKESDDRTYEPVAQATADEMDLIPLWAVVPYSQRMTPRNVQDIALQVATGLERNA